MAMCNKHGGFDCEFVEVPPKVIQSECPLCLLVLCEPYQVTCCGYSYCKVCIERVKRENEPCPCCKNDFDDFPNKGLQRSLSGFKVSCVHKKEGCQWSGDYGQLASHLNLDPPQHGQLEGCLMAEVPCIYCHKLIKRSSLQVHQSDNCHLRPFTCEYCKEFHSCYVDVVSNHMPSCGSRPVACPNECGASLLLMHADRHVSEECPLTVITVQVYRKDLPPHHCIVSTQLDDQLSAVRREYADFKKGVASLTRVVAFGQIEMILDNFNVLRWRNGVWRSAPFYSDSRGYKFYVAIAANGVVDAMGTHISVVVYLMRGSFDRELRWPFRGKVTIQLMDRTGSSHITQVFEFLSEVCPRACKRVPFWRDTASVGAVKYRFVSHNDLLPKYLRDNCLYFQVSRIELV